MRRWTLVWFALVGACASGVPDSGVTDAWCRTDPAQGNQLAQEWCFDTVVTCQAHGPGCTVYPYWCFFYDESRQERVCFTGAEGRADCDQGASVHHPSGAIPSVCFSLQPR